MSNPLDQLREAFENADRGWERRADGALLDVDMLSNSGLARALDTVSVLRRRVEGVQALIANRIAQQSRPELGAEALAKQHGYRNATVMISAVSGTTMGEANRSVAVGEATAPRMTFTGDAAPARYPVIATAVASGTIGTAAASAIISMLDRVRIRAGASAVAEAEQTLSRHAPGLTTDQLNKIISRAEAYLDPDGAQPKDDELRASRSVIIHERGGLVHLTAKLDAATAAPIITALDAIVTAELQSNRDKPTRGHGSSGAVHDDDDGSIDDHNGIDGGSHGNGDPADIDAPRKSLPNMRADALALLAAHWLGCTEQATPATGATVIVRIAWSDLVTGTGVGTIDGINQPVSAATVRKMGASGGCIPWVMGADSEILDWGRKRRLFTKAQRHALAERDGGCAMCGLPPGMTKAHHIAWWERDTGPTDLANGILLCEACHHRIHDNDWRIRIDGTGTTAKTWFIPPPHVDPDQTPRPGRNNLQHEFSNHAA